MMDKEAESDKDFEEKIQDWKSYLEERNNEEMAVDEERKGRGRDVKRGFICVENRKNGDDGCKADTTVDEGVDTDDDSIKDYMIDAPVLDDPEPSNKEDGCCIGSTKADTIKDSGHTSGPVETGEVKKENLSGSTGTPKYKSRFVEMKGPIKIPGDYILHIDCDSGFNSPKHNKYRRMSIGPENNFYDSMVDTHRPQTPFVSSVNEKVAEPKTGDTRIEGTVTEKIPTDGDSAIKNLSNRYMNGTIPSDISQEILEYMETKIKLQSTQIEAYKENIRRQGETIAFLRQELRLARTRTDSSDAVILKQLADRGMELVKGMQSESQSTDLTGELSRERLTVESLKNVIHELTCRIKHSSGEIN